MEPEWIYSLIGGTLIGVAVSVMLLFNGKVTGVSGILGQAVISRQSGGGWRWFFLAGLLVGGFLLPVLFSDPFRGQVDSSWILKIFAGLLVGFGTSLGSGCTSGHGVCGISRLSVRSIVATVVFIAAGVFTVWLVQRIVA